MSDISDIPLSNHEIFQAKEFVKKYKEASRKDLSNSRDELVRLLERDIDIGNAFFVRLGLKFLLELPENGEAV